MRCAFVLLFVAFATARVAAQADEPNGLAIDALPSPEPTGATAADILRWVLELEADRFEVREVAMSHLIQAGPGAIDDVAQAVTTGKLETITRGLTVLRELALSEDANVEQEARSALEQIADTKATAAAHRASATLRALDEIRQDRALRRLLALGTRIGESPLYAGQPPAHVYIEIDKRWQGETRDLRYLLWLTGFPSMHLTLTGEHVNDEWLRIVRRVENLTSLELKRVDVSDDGLNSVTELSNLQYLRLLYSPITDTSLGPLSKLKQAGAGGALTTLQLYGTRITPDASKRLAKELEGAKVDYRKGGFLGVGGDPFNNVGCLVGRVEPNTAAARAGIQQGDIILSYAGRKVEDFEGLTRMIAENEPGDRVTLEILRGETPLTAEVTLGLFQ